MRQGRIGTLTFSSVGLGCNQLGSKSCDDATSLRLIAEAVEQGITLFDTSDEYGRDFSLVGDITGWGRSEELLGKGLKPHRDEVVLATKFGPCGAIRDGVDETGIDQERTRADARGIRIAVEESLTRLDTDRIDLFQLHFPDPRYPLEETLTELDSLVREGKVREIGCANFDGDGLREAAAVADGLGVRRFASAQHHLNLMQRRQLGDALPACEELGIGFLPYYPLASGILTGKYRRGESAPAGSRLAEQATDDLRARLLSDRTFDRVEALTEWSRARGHELLELAFAWLLGHGAVVSVIAGASKPEQIAANRAAGEWVLSPAEVAEVTALVEGATPS